MKKFLKACGISLFGALLLTGSYALGANLISLDMPEAVTAAVGAVFNWGPSISITKNTNSPSGSLISGRSQVFGAFDVKARNVGKVSYLQNVSIKIQLNDPDNKVSLSEVSMIYKYCVPKGDVYGYGYNNNLSGLYCSGFSVPASSLNRVGNEYVVSAQVNWPVYSNASEAIITVTGTPYYISAAKRDAQLRVSVNQNASASGQQCKKINYGYKNKYSYSKCTPVQPTVRVAGAVGNWLKLARPYGYGYLKRTAPIKITGMRKVASSTAATGTVEVKR